MAVFFFLHARGLKLLYARAALKINGNRSIGLLLGRSAKGNAYNDGV